MMGSRDKAIGRRMMRKEVVFNLWFEEKKV